VKLKSTPAAARRLAAFAAESLPDTTQTLLGRVIAGGYVREVRPVFGGQAGFDAPHEIARQPWSAALRTVALAAQPEPNAHHHSHGLCVLEVAPGTDAEHLAADLDQRKDEVEYAYVPPVKYPTAQRSSPRKKKSGTPRIKRASSPTKKKSRRKRSKSKRPNDPLLSRQWNHAAIQLHRARERSKFDSADEIIVAVVDSGIDKEHPDLIAAIHSYENYLASTEDDRDYVGHGTHVSGIIAATINNKIGVSGICGAQIMAIKGLPRRGNAWNAEKYYKALAHPMDHGAQILNLSLGGGYDPGEEDIIADLFAAGVIVVAAMGNEFLEGNPTSYPAAYDGVIAVGATDEADRRADFSCTGPHIDLCAPGVNILSTVPRYPSEFAETVDYDAWPGTSMATPHVAAAAALLLAKHGNLSPQEVAELLTDSVDRVPGQTDWDEEHGAGRLNLFNALA
jgi:subtilisin family serine protease